MGAIIFLGREGSDPSPMLEEYLLAPAAQWLSEGLKEAGVKRFLVVCHDDDRSNAVPCFPEGTVFVTTGTSDASQQLKDFLQEQRGKVMVILRPVLASIQWAKGLVEAFEGDSPEDKDTGVCRIDAKALADALEEGIELDHALRTKGDKLGNQSVWYQKTAPMGTGWTGKVEGEYRLRQESVANLLEQGVKILDPNQVYVGPQVRVGKGTTLLPGTILKGETTLGEGCTIGPNTMITDCTIGNHVSINSSQATESRIDHGATIGPFSYIRPHCYVGENVKVGDFVELKNSIVGKGTKISHLTYVGDADVGQRVNFGCGTVTVNYDGASKFRTIIGNDAFIGCNTNLVAPVEIGDNAYTAAGSTITADVPMQSLAIARTQQVIKKQWVTKRKKRK